ncbi:hypothetical protein AB0N17_32435 [Streptomyces sp. NPDC051133]|uniref:hypothetical protein n=1 Tax=Streptomyces sp. NPDC051133 TaxID=3155521 RepID=UPI0034209FBC
MSTEARHAPVPPRPSSPPAAPMTDPSPQGAARTTTTPVPPARPGTGPTSAGPGAEPGAGADVAAAEGRTARAPGAGRDAGAPAGFRFAAESDDDPDDEPSVFAPRASRPSAGAPAPDDGPHTGPTGSATGTGPGHDPAYRRSAVPGFPDPVNPPPPPASARFPDARPSTMRERLRATTATPGPLHPARPPAAGPGAPAAAAEPPAGTAGPLPPVRRPGGSPRATAAAEFPAGTAGPLPPVRRPDGSPRATEAAEFPAGAAGPLPPVRRPDGSPRATEPAAESPAGTTGPLPPAQRPGGGSARPAAARAESGAAGRPAAPAESFSETTARLRPAGPSPLPGRPAEPRPAEPRPAEPRPAVNHPAENHPVENPPAETPSETTTRLRPIPAGPSTAPRRLGAGPLPGSPPPGPAASGRDPRSGPGTGTAAPSTSAAGGSGGWGPGVPGAPDPAFSWSAGSASRPVVSFGEPEAFGERTWPRVGPRTAAAAACLVLGLGLIGGAVTGSWLTGGDDDASANAFTTAGTLWHGVPVDQLFPPTVEGTGAGPGGADRTWTRIAVAPDSGCAHAFDPLLYKVLAPLGCRRLLRATYTDATQTYVTTVGLLFTDADPAAMSALARRFRAERLDRRADLMPRPYAAKGTAAAGFGDRQRASWTVSVLADAPVVAYAVSGWADGRDVDSPQPAADAVAAGATTAPAQAGLGNEAQGLADRIERRLRQTVGPATEKSS